MRECRPGSRCSTSRRSEWDRVIETNLKGCFLCTQRAARLMKDSGGGVIVNIGSGCNKVPFPNLVNYTASKGGIEMFTRVSAVEIGSVWHSRELRRSRRHRNRADSERGGRLRLDVVGTDAAAADRHPCRRRDGWWRPWRARQANS